MHNKGKGVTMSGGIKGRIRGQRSLADPLERVYREERAYRADRLVEKWQRVPEIGKGFNRMDETTARNTAIMLENQARLMARLTEAQLAQIFHGFTPENVLRLVRLAYPNSIRGKLFTEFAMETARDSIKYIRPVYTSSQTGDSMANRTFGDLNLNGASDFFSSDYRKAMYESTEDRYASELANGTVKLTLKDGKPENGWGDGSVAFKDGAFGIDGANYIDGYSAIFWKNEKNPLAIQARSGAWFCGNVVEDNTHYYKITSVTTENNYSFKFTILESTDGATWTAPATDVSANIKAFGRYNSDGDLAGDYLGEVELVMTEYQFRPRPLALGVSWTKLTELILDTSFGVSAEEMLLDAAGQEIKKALDFRAVRFAYSYAKGFSSKNYVEFDAEAGTSTAHDSYFHTAQLIKQAIARIGDIQLNDINRGGVSRIVGGPAAITYLSLNKGFTTKGAQPAIGGHQVGELDGIPVFKVPSSIIPDDELMTVWKNDANEADVAVAFGTLLPFYSTGPIVRKNFYTEAGIARYEDQQVLQPRYLGRIKIKNIRELQ